MTDIQKLKAPPSGFVFEDTPYGHACIDYYLPFIMYNLDLDLDNNYGIYTLSQFNEGLTSQEFANKENFPWFVGRSFSRRLFHRDEHPPTAVPPLGSVVVNREQFIKQYHTWWNTITDDNWRDYFEWSPEGQFNSFKVIDHPSNSVVVPMDPYELAEEFRQPN